MNAILRSHLINPSALRADDFDTFFAEREQALLQRIEQAMGKPVARSMVESEPAIAPLEVDDEADDA
jgi:hypothetical protein